MTVYAVDWDGTLVQDDKWPAQGDWLPGAKTALRVLLRHGKVVIYSLRISPYEVGSFDRRPWDEVSADVNGIRKMLDEAGLRDVEIHTSHGKPPADYYIDNRAVEFKGDWGKVLRKLGVQKDVYEILRKVDWNSERNASYQVRTFDTGATRDTDDGKLDYEAFFSPLVLKRRAEYMHKHRVQSDGSLRDGDNWQKGIPKNQYIKSAWRHFYDWWWVHRGRGYTPLGYKIDTAEAICALMFNCEGYLHELLKEQDG